jgi:hypothetical protein
MYTNQKAKKYLLSPDLTELVHTSDQFKCERSP